MYQLSQTPNIILGDELATIIRDRGDATASVIYLNGQPVRRQPITFQLRCNVQPLSGADLAILPEGERLENSFSIWAWSGENFLAIGDKVILGTDTFQVQGAEDWGSYVKGRAVRIDVGPDTASDFQLYPGKG